MKVYTLLGPTPQGVATETVGYLAVGENAALDLVPNRDHGAWPQLWAQCRDLAATQHPGPADADEMLARVNGVTAGFIEFLDAGDDTKSARWVVDDLIDQELEAGH